MKVTKAAVASIQDSTAMMTRSRHGALTRSKGLDSVQEKSTESTLSIGKTGPTPMTRSSTRIAAKTRSKANNTTGNQEQHIAPKTRGAATRSKAVDSDTKPKKKEPTTRIRRSKAANATDGEKDFSKLKRLDLMTELTNLGEKFGKKWSHQLLLEALKKALASKNSVQNTPPPTPTTPKKLCFNEVMSLHRVPHRSTKTVYLGRRVPCVLWPLGKSLQGNAI